MITKTGTDVMNEYRGLSTDTKPTETAQVNSLYLELDTGKFYYFDGSQWNEVGEA